MWKRSTYTTSEQRKFRDNKMIMGLDKFGFPATRMANDTLTSVGDFGENTKALEKSWYEWLNYNPFDIPVAKRLAGLFTERINSLEPENEAERIQLLKRKLNLTESRLAHYSRLQQQL